MLIYFNIFINLNKFKFLYNFSNLGTFCGTLFFKIYKKSLFCYQFTSLLLWNNQQYCIFEIIFHSVYLLIFIQFFINVPYGLEKYSLFSKYSVYASIYSFRKTFSNIYAYQIFCLLHLPREIGLISKKISNLFINWFIHFPLYLWCFFIVVLMNLALLYILFN